MHKQNGIVKHCHQHIIETSLPLLGHYKTPLNFWNYAFETLIYFINHILTSVL